MKRLVFMATLLASALLCDKYTVAPTETDYYSNTLIVTDIQGNNDNAIVIGTDSNGHEWGFICEDTFKNDVYSCIMNTKATETVTDDEIVSLRYEGNLSSIATTETGSLVTFSDGSGYYWEK